MEYAKLRQSYQMVKKISTELEYMLSDCKQAKYGSGWDLNAILISNQPKSRIETWEALQEKFGSALG